ncbi:helix-turn-helix domain-containing protein [Pseudaminobacter soli (ex Li et al. 2025)]|uniref:Transcriptional regulator n=1 Tax=Pseudaminobacter soli (ex Li et al. 2025) TaxID=1295366 RepID=A0A2P7SJU3_9HYPH|nr:helix-turn-helix transcriptional regulator [Mesorhizobium soli]PSJ62750.1 transcriptional regulator [Mesorhizobium soli]
MDDDFPRNLALLCSYHASIADACRRLGMNRQQFNKYLSGHTRPSRRNMRRMCDFFGVTEAEMLMEPAQLEQIVALRRRPDPVPQIRRPLMYVEALYRRSQSLEKYVGFYYRYFYSFGNKGMITKSLAAIKRIDDQYYWKNIEINRHKDTEKTIGFSKYTGTVLYLADRIHIVEYESLNFTSITQMTLYPSHQHRLFRLMGVQTGGPTRRGRKPGASKVALDYLGKEVDLRKALAGAGLFLPDSKALPADIAGLVANSVPPGAFVLEVDEP